MIAGDGQLLPGGGLCIALEELHDFFGAWADPAVFNRRGIDSDYRHHLFVAGGDEGLIDVGDFTIVEGSGANGEMGRGQFEDDLAGNSNQHLI